METILADNWEATVVSPETVSGKIKPGMSIFLGTAGAEINRQIPCTFGDTFVHVSEFDFLVRSTDPPIYFDRWETDEIWDQVALNAASIIEDESCLAFLMSREIRFKCEIRNRYGG